MKRAKQFDIDARLAHALTEALERARLPASERTNAGADLAKVQAALRRKDRPSVKVIMGSDMPETPSGLSIYRGVIVQWDRDFDDRVLGLLDAMPAHILRRLLTVQESKGSVFFAWDGPVPVGYEEGAPHIREPEGDLWLTQSSVGLLEDRILPHEKRGI